MVVKLIKFNAWWAFACAIFCILVAPMIVNHSLVSMGIRPDRIVQDQSYLLAVSFVRIISVLLFAYAMAVRLILKRSFDPDNLRQFFSLFVIGAIVWGGMLIFLIFVKSVLLATIAAIGLLEWILIPAILLFEYKKTDSWEAVRPEDQPTDD